ncbi:hypothetical protein [Nocardia crassostreae]|uniref:hypothetical protein n=1 Tax=Nocardia crassostreae TaxID=53428 RepID=UPI000A7FDF14|nr:hypothetical protein [Nocardia crassostreae]
MPDQHSNPDFQSSDSADRPLSRRERRGKTAKQQQPIGGKVHDRGRSSVPVMKHQNSRRG